VGTHADPPVAVALERLRDELGALELGLEVPGAGHARRSRTELIGQVDDYLLPRVRQMDAPLLMVVGGSTGAGKSTLVNSLVGATVTAAGVLRPTTRAPVLVCHPSDVAWFEDDRILPGLARTSGHGSTTTGLQLRAVERLPAGLALLDAPDIDSVVEANRELAGQLLAAADSWLFVTTAARYADAVPWDLLHAARERGTALSLVLNRVPPEAEDEVAAHLQGMLEAEGLGGTPLLVVAESALVDGRLPDPALAPVRSWFDALTGDARARGELVRRTLGGALDSIAPRVEAMLDVAESQRATAAELQEAVDRSYAGALEEVDTAVRDGSLLRGEVLARWQEVVGTGDVMRALETRVGWVRDRVRSLVTGAPPPQTELKAAVETRVESVVHAAADRAAELVERDWRHVPAGRALLAGDARLDAASATLVAATGREVRAWQGHVFDLVSQEGAGKRATARLASLGVNGAGLTVMLAVFTSTGGLTGAEIAVAGGTSALGQKVLEAIFGDQAVRSLADRARRDLMARVGVLLDEEADRFRARLAPAAPTVDQVRSVRDALATLRSTR
jgi:energy-coupling factor transporter ATP-binding protein EcfA2